MKDAQQKVDALAERAQSAPRGATPAELIATQLEQLEVFQVLGIRASLRGWEELPAKCTRKGGLVTEESMREIPDADRAELAARCLEMREVTQDQE